MRVGILLAILANLLFGVLFLFAKWLQPLSGEAMFAFRIVTVIPAISLAVWLFYSKAERGAFWARLKREPLILGVIVLLSLNTAVQLWLFLWAPSQHHALDISVGYLLLPIMMSAVGRFYFKEALSRRKKLAVGVAFLGVLSHIAVTQAFSWVTLVVCLAYPIYWILRKQFQINHLMTFLIELLLILPFALYFMAAIPMQAVYQQNSLIYIYLILLGLVSGSAFIIYILASQRIPINLLGMIGYIEPILMFFISLYLGETVQSESIFLFFCLFISVCLTIWAELSQFNASKSK